MSSGLQNKVGSERFREPLTTQLLSRSFNHVESHNNFCECFIAVADAAGQELEALKQILAQNEDVNCQIQILQASLRDREEVVQTLSAENQR